MNKKFIKLLALACFLFFVFPFTVYGATIYVNSISGDDTTGDGTSENPYKTFHKGYISSTDGDIIDLTGIFTWTDVDETGDTTPAGYTIAKNITIQGQSPDTTIIQAASGPELADRGVLTISSEYSVTINDVTIRYAYKRTNSSGGGINNQGTLNVNRCAIYENHVWHHPSWGGYGGGIRNAGTLTVNDSTINNNFAQSQGGGIVNAYTASGDNVSYITNTTIAFNSTAATVATVGGAGLYIRSGTAYVTNSTISYNVAPDGTGDTTGIDVVSGSTLYIKNSIVAGNKVTVGGADYNVNYSSGNFFDITNSGTMHDNGGNIFGKVNTAYTGVSFAATSWYDLYGNGAGNDIFTLHNTATTGSLYLDTVLADNGTLYGNNTLAITNGLSVAVDQGLATANGPVSIPSNDARGASRNGSIDIGAYEYDGGLSVSEPTVQASNIIFSSVQYNQMTIDWTNGDGSKRVVFVKQANTGTAVPVDLTAYTANTVFGSGTQIGTSGWYSVYNDTGTSVTITGLAESTDYIVQIFEYNGTIGYQDYLISTDSNNPKVQATVTLEAPTVQASSVIFPSVSSTQMTVEWSNGNGAKRTVFVKTGSSGIASPLNETTYTANTIFGSGTQIGSTGWYAVYNDTGTSVTVNGLLAATTYQVHVVEYNGSSGEELYLTDSATNNPNNQRTNDAPTGEDFETGDFSANAWSFGGTATNYEWTISSSEKNSGSYSAQAGAFNEHSRTSYMEITLDIAEPGNITYYRKVSSESNYDYFRFYIDGVLKESISGSGSWGQSSYVVDAGTRTFKWEYYKDGSVNHYSDTVWIDDIVFPEIVVESYSLEYTAGENGTIEGSTTQAVESGGSGTAITAVPNFGYSFVRWSDDSTENPRTDINVTENITVEAIFALISSVSNVSAEPSSNEATITWNSSVGSSSKVFYGLTINLVFQTEKELNNTTSHSVTLSDLVPCTRYYYQAQSEDEHEITATSTIASFQTTGCETGTEIENGTEETIDETLGGELELINNSSLAKLIIPNNYANKQAAFQINRLGVSGITAPTDTELIDENVFKLVAIATSDGEQITVFDNDLTFIIACDSSVTDVFNEDTLDVYRYNDGTGLWEPLGCELNKSNRTLTCTISSFSVYGVFGAFKSVSSVVSSRSTGSSAQNQVSNLIAMGNYEHALQIMKEYPRLFSEAEIETISKEKTEKDKPAEEKSVFSFYRNLTVGSTGEDVKELQKFLNANNFLISSTGSGSPGQETAYFGELTRNALARFQEVNNIHPPQGYFGPITRNFISGVEGEITVQVPIETESGKFNRNLTVASTGEDVKELQRFLNENGFAVSSSGPGSFGNETTYFGELTKNALAKFQEDNNISPALGYFGPITRGFVNK